MAKKSEKRLAIEKMIAESNEEISIYFNFQGNAYHGIGFDTGNDWIIVRFSYIEDMFAFTKWLTTYAHIAPE